MNMTDALISLPYKEFCELMENARRVPELEKQMEELRRTYDGLRQLYSEVLEALRR